MFLGLYLGGQPFCLNAVVYGTNEAGGIVSSLVSLAWNSNTKRNWGGSEGASGTPIHEWRCHWLMSRRNLFNAW